MKSEVNRIRKAAERKASGDRCEKRAVQLHFSITELIKLSSPPKPKALNLHPILLHTLPLSVPHPSSAA